MLYLSVRQKETSAPNCQSLANTPLVTFSSRPTTQHLSRSISLSFLGSPVIWASESLAGVRCPPTVPSSDQPPAAKNPSFSSPLLYSVPTMETEMLAEGVILTKNISRDSFTSSASTQRIACLWFSIFVQTPRAQHIGLALYKVRLRNPFMSVPCRPRTLSTRDSSRPLKCTITTMTSTTFYIVRISPWFIPASRRTHSPAGIALNL